MNDFQARVASQQVWPNVLAKLTSRRGLMVLAIVLIVAALALNWSWLLAIGVAPILLSVLPCLVMCTVGVCMSCRKSGGDSDKPS
jgi:hypothetical protein